VEKFGKRPRSSNDEITRPFQKARKRDDPEVRKAVLMTTECGQNYIRTKPGGVKEPTLTHHTFFTTKFIPRLDKLIDDKNMGKNLGLMYNLPLQLDHLYSSPIEGLPDKVRTKVSMGPYVLFWLADVQGFHKQVGSFPRSRYDCDLQDSSRILPT
jgi:hypothetical protein